MTTGCEDCPLAGYEGYWCAHPEAQRQLDDAALPGWCPLRKGPLTVALEGGDAMTLLKAARAHLVECVDGPNCTGPGDPDIGIPPCQRCADLRAAIAEAEKAGPVTAEEIASMCGCEPGSISARWAAALVAERTAAAVEQARREEREACARVAEAEHAHCEKLAQASSGRVKLYHEEGGLMAARIADDIRARGEKP